MFVAALLIVLVGVLVALLVDRTIGLVMIVVGFAIMLLVVAAGADFDTASALIRGA